MLVLTLIFAVLNICLGFALAMYLGYGRPGLSEPGNASGTNSVETISEPDAPPSLESPRPRAVSTEESSLDDRQATPDIDMQDTTVGETASESYENAVV